MNAKSPVDPLIVLAKRLTEELLIDIETADISRSEILDSLEWIAMILEKGSVVVDGFIAHRKALNRASLSKMH